MALPEIRLNWQPPLKPGSYPENREAINALDLEAPGVYACIQTFDGFSGIYIGQSQNLRKRIHEHLAATIGFQYWIRGSDSPRSHATDAYAFTHPDQKGLGQFNNLEKSLALAMDEANRTEFHYCRLKDLSPRPSVPDTDIMRELEALLIDALFDLAKEEHRILQENGKREPITGLFSIDREAFSSWLLTQVGGQPPQL